MDPKVNTLVLRTLVGFGVADGRWKLRPQAFIDGHPLVDHDKEGLAIDLGAIKASVSVSGEYFIITCQCGIPDCAGLYPGDGVFVSHDDSTIHWDMRSPQRRHLIFDAEAYRLAVEQGEQDFYQQLTISPLLDVVPNLTLNSLEYPRKGLDLHDFQPIEDLETRTAVRMALIRSARQKPRSGGGRV